MCVICTTLPLIYSLPITHIGIKPMTEVFALKDAAKAYEHMMSGKARFRVVITPSGAAQ